MLLSHLNSKSTYGFFLKAIYLAMTLLLTTPSFAALPIENQEPIRVRILKSKQDVIISGFGLRIQGDETVLQFEILPKKKKLHISREGSAWKVVNVANSTQAESYSGNTLRIVGDLLKIGGDSAAGEQILIASGAKFDLISELSVEEYLKGVLPSEMPTQWPREALKAQAVAARSYALSLMRERAREPYHVDDTVNHQVFHMQNYTGASLVIKEKLETALKETRGVFLAHTNSEAYKTYFHSDCGGSTEEPKFVWAVPGQNGTVKDERCAINPKSMWSAHIPRAELDKSLSQIMGIEPGFKISAITVGSNTDSGRIYELLIHFGSSNMRALNAQEFRKIFGFNRVKSTNFEMNLNELGLDLKGRGHGHGAGMCQKGARFMALAGSNYLDILKRYYPHALIKQQAVFAKASVSK